MAQVPEGGGAPPAISAGADMFSAIWGGHPNESAYHAARSAGFPRGPLDGAIVGPLMVLSAARWGIDDETLAARVVEWTERTGHARGRALLAHARKRLGAVVAPKEIDFRQNLPKTRSGKIMRRLLKARELGLPEGDISTLESDET